MRNSFLGVDLSAVDRVWSSVQDLLNCSLLLEHHKRKTSAKNQAIVYSILATCWAAALSLQANTLEAVSHMHQSNNCCIKHKFYPLFPLLFHKQTANLISLPTSGSKLKRCIRSHSALVAGHALPWFPSFSVKLEIHFNHRTVLGKVLLQCA